MITITTSQTKIYNYIAEFLNPELAGKKISGITVSSSEEIEKFCKDFCSSQALQLLQNAANRYSFSPRSQAGCLKLARTIADMQGKSEISEVDMAEAVSYRKESGGMELAFAG